MNIINLNEKKAVQKSLHYQQNNMLNKSLVGVRKQGKSKVKLRTLYRDNARHSAYDTEEVYAIVRKVINQAREEVVCGNVVEFDDTSPSAPTCMHLQPTLSVSRSLLR